jgi:Domain of unknown function (DUF4389)
MTNGSYPARLDFQEPLEVKNWRPLVNWILAIPHWIILYALRVLRAALTVISFFAVLFTGKYPQGMRAYIINVKRCGLRVSAYAGLLRDEYPPFSLS